MIIYEFTTWSFNDNNFNGLFGVEEIEVEEKTKTYIGKGCRINKDDIGLLRSNCGNKMYLLENKPEIYINAMIARYKDKVNTVEIYLANVQKELSKWSALAEEGQ